MRLSLSARRAAACLWALVACQSESAPSDADSGDIAGPNGAWRSTGFEVIDGATGKGWMAVDITAAEYEALQLPVGWSANPRDLEASFGEFLMSPSATEVGTFEETEIGGFLWRHVVTITERGLPADDEGLLLRNIVAKHHRLTHEHGREMTVLTDPEGITYLRVTRDPTLRQNAPTLPAGWTLDRLTPAEEATVLLTPPTTLFRTDNQDSFQGPVDLTGVVR